ncbi:MAG: class I SAM-dependent methyltransferase [Candidatus Baltobacteraceae bacterium]
MEEDQERNRRAWNATSDAYQGLHLAQLTASPTAWGVWSLPETQVGLLGDVRGRDVLEYGCGGAQWSIALAKLGARCTGLDFSERQLEHAARAIRVAGVDVRLVHAPAEATPFDDASFDVVFCDHGAMSFAAPETTIPEVARTLRPGGILAFSVEHPLHALAWDDATNAASLVLHRPYFGLGRFEDSEDGSVSHTRPVSTYVELLLANGFHVERLLEPQPAPDAATSYEGFVGHAWARDFPAELMIRARLSHDTTSPF